MFRHVVVGNLDRGAAWDALALPLTAAGRSFSLDVVADIVEATAGYPYSLQFFGAYPCRSVATTDVSVDDYRALEPALLHELDLAFFEDRFEGASPTEQRVLEAMGRSHGQIRIGTLRLLRSLRFLQMHQQVEPRLMWRTSADRRRPFHARVDPCPGVASAASSSPPSGRRRRYR